MTRSLWALLALALAGCDGVPPGVVIFTDSPKDTRPVPEYATCHAVPNVRVCTVVLYDVPMDHKHMVFFSEGREVRAMVESKK